MGEDKTMNLRQRITSKRFLTDNKKFAWLASWEAQRICTFWAMCSSEDTTQSTTLQQKSWSCSSHLTCITFKRENIPFCTSKKKKKKKKNTFCKKKKKKKKKKK